jgi:hypothetical protein
VAAVNDSSGQARQSHVPCSRAAMQTMNLNFCCEQIQLPNFSYVLKEFNEV